MLISIAFMLMLGMFLGWVCRKLRLPGLMGMIFTGVLLGPYALNLIDGSILNISSELRRIALIIILMRAGLSLDLNDLKKVGRPAVLMCFLPACFEILGNGPSGAPATGDFGSRRRHHGSCGGSGVPGCHSSQDVKAD